MWDYTGENMLLGEPRQPLLLLDCSRSLEPTNNSENFIGVLEHQDHYHAMVSFLGSRTLGSRTLGEP